MDRKLIPLITLLVVLGVILTVLCSAAFQDPDAPFWIGAVFGLSGGGMFLSAYWVLLAAQYEDGDDDGE